MVDYGVAVTWGQTLPGRERKALELWAEAVAFSDRLVSNGRVERWDAVVFEPSADFPAGAVRYYGTADQVDALTRDGEFSSIVQRGQLLLRPFTFRRFVTGQALLEEIGRLSTIIDSV